MTAVGFLTRIPVPSAGSSSGDLGRSAPWFPLVGGAIGAAVGAVRWLGGSFLPDLAAAVAAVAVGLLITGALHEDGTADTFDGLGSRSDRRRTLEIMGDPAIGSFGASALLLSLSMKVALLAAVTDSRVVVAAAVAGAASRGLAAGWAGLGRPAADGLGSRLSEGMTARRLVLTGAATVGAAAVAGPMGLVGLGVAIIPALAVTRWSEARIGGLTGDVLGAVQVVSELTLLAASLAPGAGWHL